MRFRGAWAWSFASALAGLPLSAVAQENAEQTTVQTTVIQQPAAVAVEAPAQVVLDTQQIDRFSAIEQIRADIKTNPKIVADWIILAELAHDVAMDLPRGQDGQYYKLSRESYENALRLDPTNNALKAAVQFARDQEARVKQLDDARQRASTSYLAARRRELAASGNIPTVRSVYAPPASPPVAPAPVVAAERPVAVAPAVPVVQSSLYVPKGPTYIPFVSTDGTPLTYDAYAKTYNVAEVPLTSIVTVRQSTRPVTPLDLKSAIRRTTGVTPGP